MFSFCAISLTLNLLENSGILKTELIADQIARTTAFTEVVTLTDGQLIKCI